MMGGNSMSALYEPINNGDTELLKKTLTRFGPAVPLLLRKQFDTNSQYGCFNVTPTFCTALQFCIIRNEPECLRIVLEAGGDPCERGQSGNTLLHRACKRNSVGCVKVLIEHGASVHQTDEWGVYPIHLCAGSYGNSTESLEILDMLLEAGHASDISIPDAEYGKTPLHYAAYHGNTNMCRRLIELGVDINIKDRTLRTPYQSAERQTVTQNFLRDQGATVPDSDFQSPRKPYPTSPLVQMTPLSPPNNITTSTAQNTVQNTAQNTAQDTAQDTAQNSLDSTELSISNHPSGNV